MIKPISSVMPKRHNMQASSSVMSAIIPESLENRDGFNRLCKREPDELEWLGAFLIPPFQRPAVWTREQNIKLLESLWLGYSIGQYVIIDSWGQYTRWSGCILDGQQRIRALLEYRNDAFPVFGYKFSEMPPVDQRNFGNMIFPRASVSSTLTEAEYREIYNRLNYGGTAHTEDQRA